jgi:hypothetical protein
MASPSRTAAKEFVDLFEATFSERLERWRLKAEAYEAKLTERGAKARRPRRPYNRRPR